MSLQHTPLAIDSLSQAAQRALGPGQARAMAARGLVPLPPGDQAAVLYQLALDEDQALARSARMTAANLPDKLLAGTLGDARLDPRIVDFFAGIAGSRPVVFDAIALNAATADATIATLAELAGAREIDLIAQNEQRLLRHPEIIAAMYMNRNARMSTVDRVVELAVRNNVRVPGLAAWDEVARALGGGPEPVPVDVDALFVQATAALDGDDSALTKGDADQPVDPDAAIDVSDDDKRIDRLTIPGKIRLATLGNAFHRNVLIRDPVKLVSQAAIKSPGVTDIEAARYAGNANLSDDVIRYIAQRGSWTRLYAIKVSLCRNPKTPIAQVSNFLQHLRPRDLETIMRSKGVSSAVVAQAKKLQMQRRGGNK